MSDDIELSGKEQEILLQALRAHLHETQGSLREIAYRSVPDDCRDCARRELEWIARRRTDLTHLSGEIVDLGRRLGVCSEYAHLGPWHRVKGTDSIVQCECCGMESGK